MTALYIARRNEISALNGRESTKNFHRIYQQRSKSISFITRPLHTRQSFEQSDHVHSSSLIAFHHSLSTTDHHLTHRDQHMDIDDQYRRFLPIRMSTLVNCSVKYLRSPVSSLIDSFP